ncbi:MAG: hypothetical protein WC755_09250 [Candidatus Woesearchaeota archaeon]|jgi:hypothetical protein
MKNNIIVYKEAKKMEGFIVKQNANFPQIVVVNVDGKEIVGRLVNNYVEL